jgi:hypothetical protein
METKFLIASTLEKWYNWLRKTAERRQSRELKYVKGKKKYKGSRVVNERSLEEKN